MKFSMYVCLDVLTKYILLNKKVCKFLYLREKENWCDAFGVCVYVDFKENFYFFFCRRVSAKTKHGEHEKCDYGNEIPTEYVCHIATLLVRGPKE